MEKKDPRKIIPDPQKELGTNVILGGKKYLVLTEDFGVEKHLIITRVYLGGEIISTKKTDYKDILNTPYQEKLLKALMQSQHEKAVTMLRTTGKKSLPDYLDEIKTLLQKKNHVNALKLLSIALDDYPDDPFLLSYYGCLEAILNKNYKLGIETCSKAIKMFKGKTPFGQEFFYPIFYLNLGRTHLAAGNKKKAIEAFHKGLTYDHENKDLLREIKKLGMRRKPVVRFLSRSHPINKYIGMILNKLKST
jgi:tetratricopeptide (TPR) repeat protein